MLTLSTKNLQMNNTYSKKTECVIKEVGKEHILVPITDNIAEMNTMYNLNEMGAFIWNLIDGELSNYEIAEKIIEEYEIDIETAKKDVDNFTEKISALLKKI